MSGLDLWHGLKVRVETQNERPGSLLREKQQLKKMIWAVEHKVGLRGESPEIEGNDEKWDNAL